MNVYDFDNTILRGDSTARFFAYCFLRMPRLWPRIPAQAANGLMFLLGLRPKQEFKQRMLSFVEAVPNVEKTVERFWDKNEQRVKSWYRDVRQLDDVVISASPEFLIVPICQRLGVRWVMGSPVDPHTGRFFGPNCHGKEKVRRFYAQFPDGRIDRFYSDSRSDTPLARVAEKSFLVKGDRLYSWEA